MATSEYGVTNAVALGLNEQWSQEKSDVAFNMGNKIGFQLFLAYYNFCSLMISTLLKRKVMNFDMAPVIKNKRSSKSVKAMVTRFLTRFCELRKMNF